MKFLITGATGLVGGSVVQKLLEHYPDNEIVSLGRNVSKLEQLQSKGSKTLQFDILGSETEYQKLTNWGGTGSTWIHCAAAITGAKDDELELVNIKGTQKLVDKAKELEVSKFILISSIATYGLNSDHTTGFEESDKQNPQSKYGESKLGQELIVKNSDLDFVIFRPPFIGGPGDVNVLPEFWIRMKNKKMPYFSKKGYFGYVDARDIANAIILAIENDVKKQSYNIQGTPIRLDDFISTVGKVTDLSPPYGKNYPYFLVMLLATILDIFARIQRKSRDRSISRYRIKSLTSNRILNTSKIVTDLKFTPLYNLEQSIADWYSLFDAK